MLKITAACALVAGCGGAEDIAEPQAGEKLVLAGDGIRILAEDGAQILPFGDAAPDIEAQIERALGRAPEVQDEGGCSTLSWMVGDHGMLDIYVQDGHFVGYHGGPGFRSPAGIGFGSARAEFETHHGAIETGVDAQGQPILTSTEGYRAVAEGPDPDSALVSLEAGISCSAG